MNNIELAKKITGELSKLTYRSDSSFQLNVVNKRELSRVEEVILSILNDARSHEVGVIQAKVKFYEEMISKSNFRPFVEELEE